MFGPFAIDDGRTTIMRSATGVTPTEATHIRQSELCATCHTLYTKALRADGDVVGSLPEQMPYLEWRHSAFRGRAELPVVPHAGGRGADADRSVLGEPRPGLRDTRSSAATSSCSGC